MLINEDNIKEALRVVGLFEDEVLKSLGENGAYIKTGEMYATRKLQACAEVLVCLETNDRMTMPSPSQLGFALSLAGKDRAKAKSILATMDKSTVGKLSAIEISSFIDSMKEGV
jgi:hypothetical protein